MLQVWPTPYLFAEFTRIDAFVTLVLGRLNSLGIFADQRALPGISFAIQYHILPADCDQE
jgi:hypothetical protein